MTTHLSRRQFLHGAAAAGTMLALVDVLDAAEPAAADLPLVDYHVHRDNTTVEKLLEISARRGVKFGIVEHAGTRENDYPVILSSDDELKSYLASLEGKPVYRGVQAEWIDWMSCFSKDTIAQLDYVLTDAMTIHGSDGRRAKMWTPQFDPGPPPEEDWEPVFGLAASARKPFGEHWSANGEFSYNKNPNYNEFTLLGGLRYSF